MQPRPTLMCHIYSLRPCVHAPSLAPPLTTFNYVKLHIHIPEISIDVNRECTALLNKVIKMTSFFIKAGFLSLLGTCIPRSYTPRLDHRLSLSPEVPSPRFQVKKFSVVCGNIQKILGSEFLVRSCHAMCCIRVTSRIHTLVAIFASTLFELTNERLTSCGMKESYLNGLHITSVPMNHGSTYLLTVQRELPK